ncbi:AAA family ATPase [Pseudorhodoferax sp.]|uniref:AAA family ATPase n=1 Tax=Pseudorhodoferax sp. TaxID=1993553 RepID=UPI002DD6962C|nr:AAA family ATPase [Pseudorhodoferax sp.]
MNSNSVVIRRVVLRNYKSIAACDVRLGALTFLVGANGSGKSNFLDSMRFVADSLRTSLDHALRDRGTVRSVRRISGGHPNHFALRLDFCLPDGGMGHYSFRIGAKPNGGYEVQNEECRVWSAEVGAPEAFYAIKAGQVVSSSSGQLPATLPDRLMLVAASGQPAFRPVFDALSRIEVYNLNPSQIASLQRPDPGELLRRDGSNAASVLQNLDQEALQRVNAYLSRLVPGVQSAESKTLGQQETLEFRQIVAGQRQPWRFLATSMSDGTLRALGVLLAIHQRHGAVEGGRSPSLIGLEEPETALHPAAASVLLAALREASHTTQTVVTSHSPDLLDNPDIAEDAVYAVENRDGLTRIGPIDAAGREMLQRRLFTPGELLRQNQLAPDESAIADVRTENQLGLFELAVEA